MTSRYCSFFAVGLQRADVIWQSDLNFQAKAIEALQHAAEDYLVHLFEDVSCGTALMPQRCRLCRCFGR